MSLVIQSFKSLLQTLLFFSEVKNISGGHLETFLKMQIFFPLASHPSLLPPGGSLPHDQERGARELDREVRQYFVERTGLDSSSKKLLLGSLRS